MLALLARKLAFGALALLFAADAAVTAESARPVAIHVPQGVSQVPLTSDGTKAMLVLARRENFNAHGFDVLSIYVPVDPESRTDSALLLVPVWEGRKENHELRTSEGADCKLTTFRFFAEAQGDLQLVVARRAFGTSFADNAEVTFTYFTLRRNEESTPGRPKYYFESSRSVKAKKPYCDVDEAFEAELGLGPL